MNKEKLRALGLLYHRKKKRLRASYPCGQLEDTELKPSQGHPVKGQEAQGTNGNVGSATQTLKILWCKGDQIQEKLLSLHPWKYSKPNWTSLLATSSS